MFLLFDPPQKGPKTLTREDKYNDGLKNSKPNHHLIQTSSLLQPFDTPLPPTLSVHMNTHKSNHHFQRNEISTMTYAKWAYIVNH